MPELVEYLESLVRCETVEDSVALTAETARELGFDVELCDGYLVTRRGAGSVVLNGHLDVVDPLLPVELRDGNLYGRGTSDAKGPFASLLFGAAASECDVTVVAVTDEETGGATTLRSLEDGVVGDVCIVGEPTELALATACRGFTRFRLTVRGVHAHPGAGFEGVNAIVKMAPLLVALDGLQAELDRRYPCPLYDELPLGHLINIATVRGGESLLAVPDLCVAEGSAGVIGDDTVEQIQAAILEVVDGHELEWIEPAFTPAYTPADHPFVRAAVEATGARVVPLLGGSDLRHYHAFGIPGFHLGPGSMRRAHGPDEYVELDQVVAAAEMTAATIRAWSRVSSG
ncbi:MAG TPA: M20/M25/M40 family metallo-hydrolase [Gaiellaceae bacterium]|nr:M20/M25/M40 family metallo-hydrolase [Gaiellaceae bacterium]